MTYEEWMVCGAECGSSWTPDPRAVAQRVTHELRGRPPVRNISYVDIQEYLAWLKIGSVLSTACRQKPSGSLPRGQGRTRHTFTERRCRPVSPISGSAGLTQMAKRFLVVQTEGDWLLIRLARSMKSPKVCCRACAAILVVEAERWKRPLSEPAPELG